MRIAQVIDSLEVGGAERMAVNYANALSARINFSGLVATRAEGKLLGHLGKNVDYLFLNKRTTFDLNAVRKLKEYCKKNQIGYLQAHSSSYFICGLVKLIYPKIKIIWHDHNGMSEFVSDQKPYAIRMASILFDGIIVVNKKLQDWALNTLHTKKVTYIPNFTVSEDEHILTGPLNGSEGKRILCLANLREQKNHFLLLEVALRLKIVQPEWTFHLVGKDFNDEYSDRIRRFISDQKLQDNVFLYGTRTDTSAIINNSDIAILTSKSEGLPVSLLEFGLYKKAVVVTSVGEIPSIIVNGSNGMLVPSGEADKFYDALLLIIENTQLRTMVGNNLYKTVLENYSEHAAMVKYLQWINL